jgi:hypothetical protein
LGECSFAPGIINPEWTADQVAASSPKAAEDRRNRMLDLITIRPLTRL